MLLTIVALAWFFWWVRYQFTHVLVDDARVANDMVVLSSRVPGWVKAFRVTDGDSAQAGSLLVEIDSRDSALQLSEFDARLASIAARREALRARIDMVDLRTASAIQARSASVIAAEASLMSATAQLNLAKIEQDRAEVLAPTAAVSGSYVDQTRANYETARHQVSNSAANLQNMRATVAQARADRDEIKVLRQEIAELDPQEQLVRAQRARAALDLQDRSITMPFDGVVDKTFVDAGEYVASGQRLLVVHDPKRIRIEANVKETDIRFFRPGKKVRIKVDALPGTELEGSVISVGQAANSEFALLPNPNPSGNFTKITQRLPIRIGVHQGDGRLKPGMMVEVEATTDE